MLGVILVVLAVAVVACTHAKALWSSTVEGVRDLLMGRVAVCSASGEDCSMSGCCQEGGKTCFQKNEQWASCLDACTPSQTHAGENWTCTALGQRARFQLGCTWAGDDCGMTKQCCQRGFQCLSKDEEFAGCVQVEAGPWDIHGAPETMLAKPVGWQGAYLGGWRSEFEVYATTEEAAAGTTLFCFAAVLPGSEEESLMTLAREMKAGIFACDSFHIFNSAMAFFLNPGSADHTFNNTAGFVKIWKEVSMGGKHLLQDWTVKADPDSVFFPARLRQHLRALRVPSFTPVYVKSCPPQLCPGGWLGALEILTKTAVENFLDNAEDCVKHMGPGGEDDFLKDCLDSLGVGFMQDDQILHPSPAPVFCQVHEFVAWHPMRPAKLWKYCHDLATREIPPPGLRSSMIAELPESIRPSYKGI